MKGVNLSLHDFLHDRTVIVFIIAMIASFAIAAWFIEVYIQHADQNAEKIIEEIHTLDLNNITVVLPNGSEVTGKITGKISGTGQPVIIT